MTETMNQRSIPERPVIAGLQEALSPDEQFQNEVLRPIFKMKHDSLILILKDYLKSHHIDLSKKDVKKRTEILTHLLKTNKHLKALFQGLIVGQFTTEEMNTYLSDKVAHNKRIKSLLTQRISSAAMEF